MMNCSTSSRMLTVDQLTGAPQTLLIMLAAKAKESLDPRGLFRDEQVLQIWDRIGAQLQDLHAGWMTQAGVVIRTVIFDDHVRNYLGRHPNATIVNLGAGLDTRFWRVDNGQIRWFDLDLAEPIALRRQCFETSDRMTMLAGSVTDHAWMEQIGKPDHLLIVMEGLSMFLTDQDMRELLARIAGRFPGCQMVFDAISTPMIKHAARFESFKKTSGVWQWGLDRAKDLEAWDSRIQVLSDECLFDRHPERWRWIRWVRALPRFAKRFRPAVLHLQFA